MSDSMETVNMDREHEDALELSREDLLAMLERGEPTDLERSDQHRGFALPASLHVRIERSWTQRTAVRVR